MLTSKAGKLIALLLAAILACSLAVYPFDGTWLAPIVLAYAALLWRWPASWLFLLPAALPVLDVTPWTGWFYLEEIDLILLITAMLGYWRAGETPCHARLPRGVAACMVMMTLSYAIACYRGLSPLTAPDLNAFASYLSSWNALRVLKGWCWPLVLLPILVRDIGPQLARLRTHVLPGFLTGLALVAFASVAERIAFPGLLNFSTDYRITAPFSAMHTGGAALDGFLALGFPMSVYCVFQQRAWHKTAGALALLGMVCYAALATFSRGLYLACAGSALVLAAFQVMPALGARRLAWRTVVGAIALSIAITAALAAVFATSGYRGLAAAIVVCAAAGMPGMRRPSLRDCGAGLAAGIVAQALVLALAPAAFPAAGILKPPYLLFMLACLLFGYGAATGRARIAAVAFALMILNMAFIAWHWNGRAGLIGASGIVGLSLAWLASRRQASRSVATIGTAGLIVMAIAIPVAFSSYAGERFDSSGADLDGRMRHWKGVLHMMDGDAATAAFGMGLGRYPRSYFLRNPNGELPSSLSYLDDGNKRFVRLSSGQYEKGYGEALRVLQRVPLAPHTRHLLSLDLRRDDARAGVSAMLCRRQTLYRQDCISLSPRLGSSDALWHSYLLPFDSGMLDGVSWPISAPVQLELFVTGDGVSADIDNVSLVDVTTGTELIRNGSFARSNDHWFFSSDHHHLPWHVKNLLLNAYFEQGWFGLLGLLAWLSVLIAGLAVRGARGDATAAAAVAALTGFMLVGQFDSLLDVPRIATIFTMFALAMALLPFSRRDSVHTVPAQ
jgi:hypothetical protein